MRNVVMPSTPFMALPKWLLLVPCSSDAKILYAMISSFGNTSGIRRPSINKLAEMSNCGRRKVERLLTEMEKYSLVVRVKRSNGKVGKLPNEYILREPEDMDELDFLVGDAMTAEQKKREFKNIKLGRVPKQKRKGRQRGAELTLIKGRVADPILTKFLKKPSA